MNIKNIIAIISCKGGVGKSTLAINLACSLNFFFKKKVGLLDADIYGPNHPTMLGVINNEKKNLTPYIKYGIKSMSLGYFLNEKSSVMLRGPIVSNTVLHLIKNTEWNDLDFLILDLPPGTGDIHLSLLRDIKINNTLIITTQQKTSIEDTKKSLNMLIKYNINVLALIENMTYYKCDNCNSKFYLFNNNDEEIKLLIKTYNIKNNFEIPFDKKITNSSNNGMPSIIDDPQSQTSLIFKNIAEILILNSI